MTYDVAVVGLGAAGSATAAELARRGMRVIGLDRFAPGHDRGSSHGRSRIIREAYFEHPLYVPLVQRAYALWAALERETGATLFRQTGGLMMGPADGVVVHGALTSAREHGLAHEVLDAKAVGTRFPAFALPDAHVAVWEPRAGILDPELAIAAQLRVAAERGATLRHDAPLGSWRVLDDGTVDLTTSDGTVRARQLVLAAGAWTGALLPDLALPLVVERNVVHWFDAARAVDAGRERMPIFIHESSPGRAWYGFPDLGDGLKLALHHQGVPTTGDTVERRVGPEEIARVRALADRFLPGMAGAHRTSTACLYTNTPDEHFIVDRHPRHTSVTVVSACSGHGFKFAPAIGELAADLVAGHAPAFDLAPFRVSRFTAA